MIRALVAPRMLGLHVITVALTVAAVLLGLWQYDVWQRGREDQGASQVDARPVPLASVMTSDQAFPATGVGKPVSLSGRWLPASTFYVSGRRLRGRNGVWAVTPVAVCPGDEARGDEARGDESRGDGSCGRAPAMLVVRGWASSTRTATPAPTGPVRVTGWLQPGEGSGADDPDPGDDVVPQLRVADAVQRVPQDLYGAYVIAEVTVPATAGTGRGLAKVTPAALPKASAFTSVRNLLYAVEWWFFGGFAVYVWGRWCRDEVSRVTGVPSEV